MVKKFSSTDEEAIREAVQAAEKQTSATIEVIVVSSSDHYQDFILLCGLILGTLAGLSAWAYGLDIFPWLLAIQLAVITIIDLTPALRHSCLRLLPKRLRYRRAAERAHREYVVLHDEKPKGQPFVLLYVSLAERYVHVLTSPALHGKLPDHWTTVTNRFTALISKEGLRAACVQTVGHILEILKPAFPPAK